MTPSKTISIEVTMAYKVNKIANYVMTRRTEMLNKLNNLANAIDLEGIWSSTWSEFQLNIESGKILDTEFDLELSNAYMFTMYRSRCLDALRTHKIKESRFTRVELDECQLPAEASDIIKAGTLDHESIVNMTDKLMSWLTPKEALLLRLRYSEGLTLDVISDRLNLSGRPRAHALCDKAMKKLHSAIRYYEVTEDIYQLLN